MIRVADLLAKTIAESGINQVFMVTGGGAMHLNDAFGRNKKFKITFNHHEQACAMAAESYTRLIGKAAVVNVTTGPGGINALNGVFGAYTDSIGMIVVSGQVKRETIAKNYSPELRQLGDQEVDIVAMAKPVVKYAVTLQDPQKVLETVQKALFLASNGRPGPVWIDVPIDVQSALVDESKLTSWNRNLSDLKNDEGLHPNTRLDFSALTEKELSEPIHAILQKLKSAKRPVIFAGAGVRISGSHDLFLKMIERLGVPVVSGWNAHDVLPNHNAQYAGRPGTVGDRAGNFTVQNADFLLVLGSRLNVRQVSYNWASFASKAWKAHVDIDQAEMDKHTLRTDMKVQAHLRDFLKVFEHEIENWSIPEEHKRYLIWCRERVETYPVVQEEYWKSERVNPYCFMKELFVKLNEDEVIVTGDGTACVTSFQAGKIKSKTRLYTNSGSASMGYDLPAAIGASVAGNGKRVICLAGDGSIMMNLQELQTIMSNRLPVKIFVLNNSGYHSIRQTQKAYFSDNLVGIDAASGVSFPDFVKLGKSFGYPTWKIEDHQKMAATITQVLDASGPALCEVVLDLEQDFSPKLASRRLPDGTMVSPSLEDMAPFLNRDELARNIIKD